MNFSYNRCRRLATTLLSCQTPTLTYQQRLTWSSGTRQKRRATYLYIGRPLLGKAKGRSGSIAGIRVSQNRSFHERQRSGKLNAAVGSVAALHLSKKAKRPNRRTLSVTLIKSGIRAPSQPFSLRKPHQMAIYAIACQAFSAASTSSSIFLASPNNMRLFSL